HQFRHWTQRSGQEVQLETRDHQVPAGVGELLQQINDGLFKELSFVDVDHARVRTQLVTQVLDAGDGYGRESNIAVRGHGLQRVTVVECRLEGLDRSPRVALLVEAADQLLCPPAEHAARDHLQAAGGGGGPVP